VNSPSTIFVRVRQSARGRAGTALVAWSFVIAVCAFGVRAPIHPRAFEIVAVTTTCLLGAYLGWRRRLGVIFAAPFVSWMFGWFPILVAEMIRDDPFKGFFVGLLVATVGWVAIGFVEFVTLFVIALPFRVLSGLVHHDDVITIENPFKLS
jgi:hypothetical protein